MDVWDYTYGLIGLFMCLIGLQDIGNGGCWRLELVEYCLAT